LYPPIFDTRKGKNYLPEAPSKSEFLSEEMAGWMANTYWLQFLPAMLVWPIWLFIMSERNAWGDVFEFWPASVAMILGSFIAGSTPLGGGAIAFPVAVLVLKFTAIESRDASVLVQCVGMNAASFLLILTKPDILHLETIVVNTVFGNIGMLLGLKVAIAPFVIMLIYTILVFEFGIIYFYTNLFGSRSGMPDADLTLVNTSHHGNECAPGPCNASNRSTSSATTTAASDSDSDFDADSESGILETSSRICSADGGSAAGSDGGTTPRSVFVYCLMAACALVGGFFTAHVGR
jgi:hypothetical protein